MNEMQRAASERAANVRALADRPRQRRNSEEPGASAGVRRAFQPTQELRTVQHNGQDAVLVGGYASVTEEGYPMYDSFGPYTEVVSQGSFGQTLASDPLVEFTINHGAGGGLPMARTSNDTLTLSEDTIGLLFAAMVDPRRSDVQNALLAWERGDLAEASFKFYIDAGLWNPDYTEFRISSVNINRGDVSAVNFGANPAATSGLRSARTDMAPLIARLQARSLDPADVSVLTQALGWFSAVDLIVDQAQSSLADYLQIPSPDADEAGDGTMAENADTAERVVRVLIGHPDDTLIRSA